MSEALVEDIRSLVNRALSGDQSAMWRIVEKYRQRVFSLCYRMLGQRQDAEDVSQEAFVRLFRNLPSWDQSRAFEPWLLTIAANRCRTQLASSQMRNAPTSLPFSPIDDRWADNTAADQLQEEVRLALQTLPEAHVAAFTLFHQEQLSYDEIARRLHVPQGTAKTWVHRTRKAVTSKLIARQVVEVRRAV